MRPRRWRGLALVVGFCSVGYWSTCSVAAAQSESDGAARTHFQSGQQYYETGDYEPAIREFRRAHELSQRPVLLYNIAQAQERLGQLAEAADSLSRYLAEEADVPNRSSLELRVARLRERAGSRGAAGDDWTLPTAIAFGTAGVGVLVFAGLAIAATLEDAAVSEHCGEAAGRTCTPSDVADLQTFALVADVGLGVALAGAAAGAVFLALGASAQGSESAAFLPYFGPDGGGAVVGGRF